MAIPLCLACTWALSAPAVALFAVVAGTVIVTSAAEIAVGELPPVVDPPVTPLSDAATELSTRLIPGLTMRCMAYELTRPWNDIVDVIEPLPQNHIDDNKTLRSFRLSSAATSAIIETGFESSRGHEVIALSATRAVVQYAPFNDWFLLRVRGAKGQRLRIELDHVEPGSWSSVIPIVADGEDPGDPALYKTMTGGVTGRMAVMPSPSATWAKVPDTQNHVWHFVDKVFMQTATAAVPMITAKGPTSRQDRFVFEHQFTSDCMLVAMRYPYTPSFYTHSINRWKSFAARPNSPLRVLDLGRTARGASLAAMVVSGPGWPHDRQRPIAVMYGCEHGTETDSSWAVHGALEFLISDHPKAQAIRATMTTIFIPCLDPDAAGAPCYENNIKGFAKGRDECRRLMALFTDLTDLGYRIDGVIDLHNIQGGQMPWHGFAVMSDPMPRKRAAQAEWIIEHLKPMLAERGFGFKRTVPGPDTPRFRLGGFLAYFHGSMLMPVELNMQARGRHLRLDELQELGASMLDATHRWLTGGYPLEIALAPPPGSKTIGMSATVALARRTGDRYRALRAEARRLRPNINPVNEGSCEVEWELIIRRDKRLPITPLDYPMKEYDP